MAKQPEKRPNFLKLLGQAYQITAKHDKALIPILIIAFVIPVGIALAIAFSIGSTVAIVYGSIFGLLTGILAAMFMLTRRFEKTMFAQMEGQMGGSLAVAQSIRTGWQFADQPVAVDPRTQAVVFQGVGRGGIVLLAEGGNSARKVVDQTTSRFSKLVPGVPITAIYVGSGEGQVPIKRVTREIRGVRRARYGRGIGKGLSKAEMEAVRNRLKALGAPKMPVPKGIDPLKARADRKGLKGR